VCATQTARCDDGCAINCAAVSSRLDPASSDPGSPRQRIVRYLPAYNAIEKHLDSGFARIPCRASVLDQRNRIASVLLLLLDRLFFLRRHRRFLLAFLRRLVGHGIRSYFVDGDGAHTTIGRCPGERTIRVAGCCQGPAARCGKCPAEPAFHLVVHRLAPKQVEMAGPVGDPLARRIDADGPAGIGVSAERAGDGHEAIATGLAAMQGRCPAQAPRNGECRHIPRERLYMLQMAGGARSGRVRSSRDRARSHGADR